jgi:hypothetical protein
MASGGEMAYSDLLFLLQFPKGVGHKLLRLMVDYFHCPKRRLVLQLLQRRLMLHLLQRQLYFHRPKRLPVLHLLRQWLMLHLLQRQPMLHLLQRRLMTHLLKWRPIQSARIENPSHLAYKPVA